MMVDTETISQLGDVSLRFQCFGFSLATTKAQSRANTGTLQTVCKQLQTEKRARVTIVLQSSALLDSLLQLGVYLLLI